MDARVNQPQLSGFIVRVIAPLSSDGGTLTVDLRLWDDRQPVVEAILTGPAVLLGFGTAEELPAAPADLLLFRVTLDPGASIPAEEGDPAVVLLYVESGSLTIQIEAPLQVTRAATIEAFATPGAVEEGADLGPEEVAAGTEVTLEAGDSAVLPPNAPGELRNDGDEPVVGLGALVAPIQEDGATPAA